MFARLGVWCHDRRRLVVGLWAVILMLGLALIGTVGSGFREEFNLPASESRTGFDILEEHFGGQGTNATGTIVFRAEQGVNDPAVMAAMEELFAAVAEQPDVLGVTSPYSVEGAEQISADGLIAYANVDMPENIASADSQKISTYVEDQTPAIEGLTVERGTFYFAVSGAPLSEALGLAFAIVILILALGSVLAMGLSIGVALSGIGVGISIVFLLSHVLAVPEVASILGIMMGLGVGIDYALLIVTRYREQLRKGQSTRDAVAIAIDTAGRSVVFAGCTVVISLLSLMLVGVKFVQSLGLSAAAVVAVTILASVTLLPAMLGFAGRRGEVIQWRGLIAAGLVSVGMFGVGLKYVPLGAAGFGLALAVLVASLVGRPLRRVVPVRPQKPKQETFAYRWSRFVQHRPWLGAIVAAVILLVLTVPVLSLRLGFSDESNAASGSTTKRAYNLMVEGFGPGFTGPLLLAAEIPAGTTPENLAAVTTAVGADSGVAFTSSAVLSDDGGAALWNLVPTTGPQEKATSQLVERLRDEILPPVEDGIGFQVNVTGANAVNIDYAEYLQSRLVYVFAVVLALSFFLLMVVFRSLFVPLKAVIMNLLSIGAAYGVVVALFQWGWLGSITGVQPAPIEPWTPMLLFAIVFGLSMDYEVFLLSRIREEWHRTGDSRTSVADGLAATAKVITAAAAIMVLVFGSFLLDLDRAIKLLGVGLAVAVFLDATIVRMLLVPATMELLGDKNWWLPRWLDRILPTIDVEGHAPADDHDDGKSGPRDSNEPGSEHLVLSASRSDVVEPPSARIGRP
jgi:RND superfamily putative drug exporter